MLTSVVLPAPFSPSRPWISPCATSREIALFAVRTPNCLVIPRRRSSGGASLAGGGAAALTVALEGRCRAAQFRSPSLAPRRTAGSTADTRPGNRARVVVRRRLRPRQLDLAGVDLVRQRPDEGLVLRRRVLRAHGDLLHGGILQPVDLVCQLVCPEVTDGV